MNKLETDLTPACFGKIRAMFLVIVTSLRHFLGWTVSAFRSRQNLIVDNLALRQQLLALHAKRPRRRLTTVPNENFVHADTDVIFPGEPRSSSSSRTCLRLVNANLQVRVCAREHGSATDFKRPGDAARSTVDSGSFRQPVVRSGGAVRRLAIPLRLVLAPAAEPVVARASPSPTRDAFSIGDSNRNTN